MQKVAARITNRRKSNDFAMLQRRAEAAARHASRPDLPSSGAGGTPVITVGELFMNLHTPSCSEKFARLHKSPSVQWVVSLFFEYPQYRTYAAVKQEIVKRVGFKGFRQIKGHIQEIIHVFTDEIRRAREPPSLLELQMIADGVLKKSATDLELKHDRLENEQRAREMHEDNAAIAPPVSEFVHALRRPSQARDTYRKTIFVIRHGKSVWNKAQEERDLVALIGRDRIHLA